MIRTYQIECNCGSRKFLKICQIDIGVASHFFDSSYVHDTLLGVKCLECGAEIIGTLPNDQCKMVETTEYPK